MALGDFGIVESKCFFESIFDVEQRTKQTVFSLLWDGAFFDHYERKERGWNNNCHMILLMLTISLR